MDKHYEFIPDVAPGPQKHAQDARILACVNACQGIENPEAIGEALIALRHLANVDAFGACTPIPDRESSYVTNEALRLARAALANLGGAP